MKKIALIGEWNSSNLGDKLLSEMVEIYLKENTFYKYKKIAISKKRDNNIINTLKKNELSTLKKTEFKIIIKKIIPNFFYQIYIVLKNFSHYNKYLNTELKDIDSIVFTGGQMFMWYFSFPIFLIVKKAKKKNIPVIFNSCGVGENKNLLFRFFLKTALNYSNVIYISCRDNCDYIIKNLKIKKNIVSSYDPALLCSKYYETKNNKKEDIGIGIMYLDSYNESYLMNFWKKVIDFLLLNNNKINIFCNGNNSDYMLANKIYKKYYSMNKDVNILKKPKNTKELIDIINSCYRIISMRLHSFIIASSYNISSTGIYWDNKVEYFLNKTQKNTKIYKIEEILNNNSLLLNYSNNKQDINKIQKNIENELNKIIELI